MNFRGRRTPDFDPNSTAKASGRLERAHLRGADPATLRWVRVPGVGRVNFTRDEGDSSLFGSTSFHSQLTAAHFRGGQLLDRYVLGSGLTTNVAAQAEANDFAWPQNCQTKKLANWHATGTGTTAAAATDIALQTVSTQGGQTPVAGTQTFLNAANSQTLQTVATTSYTGTEAVTEWGLFTAGTLSVTTGTPFTATSATSATATGTPYTASSTSVQGETQLIVVPGTTAVYGLIKSNTSSVLTVPAWYKVADGTAGSTPGSTESFTIKPVMYDHKVFAAINVISGDSIVWTYKLLIASGN